MLLISYAYDRNARAAYFQQKYPGLSPDEIADILTSVTTRYAGVAGGVAGAGATAGQLSTLGTFGMTAPIFVGVIGAEMIYLARMQMRLILDLSVVYDLRLDPEDPEDVLMVFGYALGVAPTEMLGAAAREAARGGTRTLVRKYVSKHVLKAIQNFAKKLGFKVLQRTIIKYTVPVASAAVGSSYNYVATKTMGKIAKTHFRHRAEFTGELRHLLDPGRTYGLIFPAAALYMARIDGEASPKEHELYKAMLSRITLSEYTQSEFQSLLDDETALVEAASGLRDTGLQRSLVEMVTLMAICDGEITESEREFLVGLTTVLDYPLDLERLELRAQDYRVDVEQGMAGKAADSARETVTTAGKRLRGLGGALRRKGKDHEPHEAHEPPPEEPA